METLIFQSNNREKIEALKAVAKALKIELKSEESPYNPEFVAKIEKSQEDRKAGRGRTVSMEELEASWK